MLLLKTREPSILLRFLIIVPILLFRLPSSLQILLSLAKSGLIPITSSCRFGAKVFAAQLLNKPYFIRYVEEGDLCSLCELDESVWPKPMRYPFKHMKKVTQGSVETIVVESKANNKNLLLWNGPKAGFVWSTTGGPPWRSRV